MNKNGIGLVRFLNVSLLSLFLVLKWTSPVFAMVGGIEVQSGCEPRILSLASVGESSWDPSTHTLRTIPPFFYANDPIGECPSSFERRVIFLINQERNLMGLPALKLDVRLQTAAQWMSEDMAAHSAVPHDHVDSLGRTFDVRVAEEGAYPFIHLGEVIAGGFSSPEAVVKAWMNSPGHKARLLDPDYEHVGVGYVYDSGSVHHYYWTADLGSTTEPRQTPSLDCDPGFYLLFLSILQK